MSFYKPAFYRLIIDYVYQHGQLLLITSLLTGASLLLSYHDSTETLDWLLYDSLQQFSEMTPADDLVVIDIDEKSISMLGRWPWSRQVHARLLGRMSTADTAAVLLDIIFSDADQSNPAADTLFAEAIEKHGRVVLPLFIKQVGLQGQVLEVPPAPVFYRAAQRIGHVHVVPERDGVVRSVFLKEGVGNAYWPHVSLALWQLMQGEHNLLIPGTESLKRPDDSHQADSMHLISRNHLNYLPMPGRDQGVLHYSYIDVLNGEIDLEALRNKTVFVGATAAGLGDIFTTSIGSMSGVELNAWIFHALRSDAFIQKTNSYLQLAINSLVVFLSLWVLGRLSPRAFLTGTLTVLAGYIITSAVLQLKFHWWLPIMPASLAVVVFYPLWSWRRLEVALNFLRKELNELNDSVNQGPYTADNIRVQKKNSPFRSTELITQTIDQLVAAKWLADANRRLIQQSLAELQDAVVISDLDGNIRLSNHAFNALTITASRNLLDTLMTIKLHDDRHWSEVLQQLNQIKTPFTAQGFHSASEKDFYCQGRLISISGNIEDTLIFTFTDISQLKAAEKSRSEALSFLSHDLRSPMVSVLAIIERQRSVANINQHILNPIEVLVRKNLDYADSFLQLSRAEALQPSQLHWCDLHAVLDAVQIHAMALTESKQMELVIERMDDEAWVMADHDLLERAVINLLSNAVKYSPDNSVIQVSLRAQNDSYEFSVSDQGCGIAEKDIPTLFERFTRADSRRDVTGAGLGLHFVATVARRHQATIQVNSQLNQGSTFILTIKAAKNTGLAESVL